MAKRLIGIDLGQKAIRLAVLTREHGSLAVDTVTEIVHEESDDPMVILKDSLKDEFHLGDRLAACLPGGAAFVRRLIFPFSDRKKISAALPFEMASQLPVSLDRYTTVMQPPSNHSEGTVVVAAAVETSQLNAALEPFDLSGIPLHVLDLAPHAYVAGLKEFLRDGLLICAMEQSFSLALIRSGEVADCRQLPIGSKSSVADQARMIHREAIALGRLQSSDTMTLQLMGPLATPELVTALGALRDRVELLSVDIGGEIVEAPLLPAVALALRAANSGKGQVFNLRQGVFALKGEWAGLRKALVMAACLAGLTLITIAASMGLNYYDKQQQAEILQQQIVAHYKETFPQATAIVDVPLQMKSAIRQLQEDVGIIAPDKPSSLHLLSTLSDLPESLATDIDEFTMERNEIRISGRSSTFEAVNRMAETFRKSPYFEKVEVAESKMDLAGKQVSYRMRMTLSGKGESS